MIVNGRPNLLGDSMNVLVWGSHSKTVSIPLPHLFFSSQNTQVWKYSSSCEIWWSGFFNWSTACSKHILKGFFCSLYLWIWPTLLERSGWCPLFVLEQLDTLFLEMLWVLLQQHQGAWELVGQLDFAPVHFWCTHCWKICKSPSSIFGTEDIFLQFLPSGHFSQMLQ